MQKILLLSLTLALFVACQKPANEGKLEEAGKKMDAAVAEMDQKGAEAMEAANQAIDDAKEATGEALDNAGKALEGAEKAAGEALDNAGEVIDDTIGTEDHTGHDHEEYEETVDEIVEVE